jgi:hypothetical protein
VAREPESRLEWAKRPFGPIFALAVASRTASEPLRTLSLGTAAAALRAYFLKQATRIEFIGTTIKFDEVRRDDGNPAFQPEPWDPDHGRVVLRLARPVFPEIRTWTEDIVDARYDPRTKLLAAIYGEPQRRAQWPLRGSVVSIEAWRS